MPKTIIGFDSERKEILNKILDILEINENKKSFLLQDIDNNSEKQQLIYDLETNIKKYFNAGSWTCFRKIDQHRKWYNMIKSINRSMNVEHYTKKKILKINDKQTSFTECIFCNL